MTLLACVKLSMALAAPGVASTEELLCRISQFVDPAPNYSLHKAAATRSLRLFDRVVARVARAFPPPQLSFALQRAMEAAIRNNDLPIAQRVHTLHPARMSIQVFKLALDVDAVDVFRWLFVTRSDGLCAKTPPSQRPPAALHCEMCALLDTFCVPKVSRIVRWLYSEGYVTPDHPAALLWAVALNEVDFVKRVLTGGDEPRETALMMHVVQYGQLAIARFIADSFPTKWKSFMKSFTKYDLQHAEFPPDPTRDRVREFHEVAKLAAPAEYHKKCFALQEVWLAADQGRLRHIRGDINRVVRTGQYNDMVTGLMTRGYYEDVKWLHINVARMISVNVSFLPLSSSSRDHVAMISWLFDSSIRLVGSQCLAAVAASVGRLDVLEILVTRSRFIKPECLWVAACKNGQPRVLEWLRAGNRGQGTRTGAGSACKQPSTLGILTSFSGSTATIHGFHFQLSRPPL